MLRFGAFAFVAALGVALGGCTQTDFEDVRGDMVEDDDGVGNDDHPGGDGPGGDALDPDPDVMCEDNSACGNGEVCLDGVCQMQRCKDGPYLSAPPLAAGLTFHRDHEFVVADPVAYEGDFWIDGYAPEPGSIEYPGSWNVGSTAVVDLAGGDFFGRNPELFVIAQAGSTRIKIGPLEEEQDIDVGFQPHALTAGDVDGDSREEVVVLGQFGNFAICDIDEDSCKTGFFQNGNGVDIAAGDIDNDGVDEAVLLLENGGNKVLYHLALEDGEEDTQAPAGHELMAIDIGDPDGDGNDEIYGIEDDGLLSSAMLYAYSGADGGFVEVASQEIEDTSRDLAFADLDMNDRDELLILREGREVEVLRASEGTYTMSREMTHQLQTGSDPHRIAATDFDGDSPRTRLLDDEPMLVPGPVVPLTLALFPPFDAEYSDGVSSVAMGMTESSSESVRDTVSLEMGIDVGVSASLFDIFKAGMSTQISTRVEKFTLEDHKKSVGVRMSAQPDLGLIGDPYGVISLSCGCFHAYYYEVDDPAGKMGEGGDEEQFVMVVPVGGSTTLWSTKRYNAMAEAVGDLPIVDIPYRLGDVESYPEGPEKLDGDPIKEEDFIFPEPPSILVSDVGDASFRLSVSEYHLEVNTRRTNIGFRGELGVGPFTFGASLGASWGKGYGVSVGESAFFSGSIPAVPDDPTTPEDEYLEFSYATLPFVYREHYTDAEGNDAGYYVISYAAKRD